MNVRKMLLVAGAGLVLGVIPGLLVLGRCLKAKQEPAKPEAAKSEPAKI